MKVLVIITTGFVPWGGLATVAMNYFRAMDKSNLLIDFASRNFAEQSLVDEVENAGGKYYKLPNRKRNFLKYIVALYKLLKREKYDVVHIHGNSSTMVFELLPAWFAGVKKRIVHVHNTKNRHKLIDIFLRPIFYALHTCRIAVSEEAGKYMYGKRDFLILNNAIDTEHYSFKREERVRCRSKYGINKDTFVVGTVGKINIQKNQKFLVDVFAEFNKEIPNSFLVIVGDGDLKKNLQKQIVDLNIENKCLLAGMQDDSSAFLSCMDCFVLPSLYEGLPLAAIEAQASGLTTIVSSNISPQTACTDLFRQVDLEKGIKEWVEEIIKCSNHELDRIGKWSTQIAEHGFDINKECNKLKDIYEG